MSQSTIAKKHHAQSEGCQKLGADFVLDVSKVIDDYLAPTKYEDFYKHCRDNNLPPDDELRRKFENEMLCLLMCCCLKNLASSGPRNMYQACVKDILDEANKLQKRKRKLPTTRFLAEPVINSDIGEVGRGRMNPDGPKRQTGQSSLYPDIGILKQIPSSAGYDHGKISINDFERFVEMKFPTESQKSGSHADQLQEYMAFNEDITFMLTGPGKNQTIKNIRYWYCECESKEKQNLLQPGEIYSPQEELDHNEKIFRIALEIITAPLGLETGLLRGLYKLGNLLKFAKI